MPPKKQKPISEMTLEELRAYASALEAKPAGVTMSGYMITAPNKKYNGVTAGIQFRGGRAFIPDSLNDSEKIAKRLSSDFGYKLERVEDFNNLPQVEQQTIQRSMIDVLSVPRIA